MDKLRELREEIYRIRNESADEDLRGDLFLADLELEQLQEFLRARLHYRETHVLMKRYALSTDRPTLQEVQIPQLFVGNQTVKQLFLREIHFRLTKAKLQQILVDQGCTGISVQSVKHGINSTVASVKCDSLASSCHIQVLACKKQLIFADPKGRISYIKVRPDQFILQNSLSALQTTKGKYVELPELITNLFKCLPAVNGILGYLSPDDMFNFYEACHGDARFTDFDMVFNSSIRRYRGENGLNKMREDAERLKFTHISFTAERPRVETPFVYKFLTICGKRYLEGDRLCYLQKLDVSAIQVSEKVVELISKLCKIAQLTLGSTPGGSDRKLRLPSLRVINYQSCGQLSLGSLNDEWASEMRVMRFNDCKEIPVDRLFQFIICNQSLKEFVFHDSASRNKRSADLILAIFAGSNLLEKCQFTYLKASARLIDIIPQVVIYQSEHLKEINVENNSYFKDWVQLLIDRSPELRKLNIKGLEFAGPLAFHSRNFLESLSLNYNTNIVTTLNSIVSCVDLIKIKVTNVLGKKKTRAIDLSELLPLLKRSKRIEISFINCRFCNFVETRRKLNQVGIEVKSVANEVRVYKV